MQKVLARGLISQILAADGVTWIEIGGINSSKINPAENEERADTTTYASAGEFEELIVQRGRSLALEGLMLRDSVTGIQDTGQLRCEQLAAAMAYAAQAGARFRYPAMTSWIVWAAANFSLGEQGGGNNDPTAWAVTISRSGPTTSMAVS